MRSPDALPPAVTIIRTSQRRSSRAGRSVAAPPRARFSLRGLRKRPGRKTGLHPRRRFVRAAPAPETAALWPGRRRVSPAGGASPRTVKGQWAKREARHGRRRGALFIWTRETRPRNARGGRGPRRGGWHLTRGEGLERRAWERIREAPTVRVASEPWNGWTSRTGPRSCTPQATGTRGPAQRCVEGAAPGPAAIGVETAVCGRHLVTAFGKDCVRLSRVHRHELMRRMASTPHEASSPASCNWGLLM